MALTTTVPGLQQPQGLPRDTWRRAQFQAMARSLDSVCLLLTVLNNLLVLSMRVARRSVHVPTVLSPTMPALCAIYLSTIVYGVLQHFACQAYPTWYFRYRPYLLVGARLMRLVNFLEWVLQMRAWMVDPEPLARITAYSTASPGTPALAGALSAVLVFSGALHGIANSVTVPLPLAPQAAFQLLYVAIMLKPHAQVAAASISMSPYAGSVQDMCLMLNTAVAMSASAHTGHVLNLQELRDTCRRSSALLLVVFAQLYFGLVLPLYCTVRIEQEVRQNIQQAQQLREHGATQPPPQQQQQRQAVSDVLLLLLAAATCWLTALSFLPELTQLSVPTLSRLQLWRTEPIT